MNIKYGSYYNIYNMKADGNRRIVVFASGSGSTLQAILDATKANILNSHIVGIISNKEKSGALKIARDNNIESFCYIYKKDEQTREEYDDYLATQAQRFKPDLIVLAGWMRILTSSFIKQFKHIINLHPALPKTFPGATAIKDALEAYQNNEIKHTGAMVHRVIEEVDAGEEISQVKVPIYNTDTETTLKRRVQYFEKPLMIEAIQTTLDQLNNDSEYKYSRTEADIMAHKLAGERNYSRSAYSHPSHNYPYYGKVRNIYDTVSDEDGNQKKLKNKLCILHTNRLSAFDKHVCSVPHKGSILNLLSKFWFDKTRHIIPNHLLYANENTMIVKRCKPFMVEVVVRGYITGNTQTSLWTHYNNGAREYCGIQFPDHLRKNQKIQNVITPTTKGEVDEPISAEQVVSMGLMKQEEWDYVANAAMKLFEYGQKYAERKGLILVDTKYEFGKDVEGNIMLIDELHTCDSSRYWMGDSYKERFIKNMEPEKLDKDTVRDYLKKTYYDAESQTFSKMMNTFPNNDKEHEVIDKVSRVYRDFYQKLTDIRYITPSMSESTSDYTNIIKKYEEDYEEVAVIIAGSTSDRDHVNKIRDELEKKQISARIHYSSAHKNTLDVMNLIQFYDGKPRKTIWVTVAGRSNALSGVVAANSRNPVIACPPFKDKVDMMTNINSTLQCPSKVPVLAILEPGNVAIAIRRMFNLETYMEL